MAKQQQFIDLYTKYDTDADGEINQEQFINLITELGVPYQYPGTVTKMIRKINYTNPDKATLSFEQAKDYYNSFESTSKHEVWKAKYSLLNSAEEIKISMKDPESEQGAAPSAAPGEQPKEDPSDKKPQQGRISILVGQALPVYSSEVDLHIEKHEKAEKVKTFVKVIITSKTEERAKQLEVIFKETFHSFMSIIAEESPDFADLVKDIHINSIVSGTKTTFFVTTNNQEVSQYLNLLAEFFQLTFQVKLACQGHLRFEFDYDFERFIKEDSSNFYDIFTRTCRLSLDVTILNLMKSLRRLFKYQAIGMSYMDSQEVIAYSTIFHLQNVQGEFEFENAESTEYETQTKDELKCLLTDVSGFFEKLVEAGIKVRELLDLLDDTINIQLNSGEWKGNVFLRLKNINKIFLHFFPEPQSQAGQTEDD